MAKSKIEKIKKNTIVIVHGYLYEVEKVLVTRLKKGVYKFNYDAYVSGIHSRNRFCFTDIMHARKVIPEKRLGNSQINLPWFSSGLHQIGLNPVYIPFNSPICYCDEIMVPDYSFCMLTAGVQYFFIIKRSNLDKYVNEIHKNQEFPSPYCIAYGIGHKFSIIDVLCPGGEFLKITLIAEDNSEFSVIYPAFKCIFCNSRWNMPNPKLATGIRKHPYWLNFFYSPEAEGISPEKIISAKKIIVESYDSKDNLMRERYVYDKYSQMIHKEFLHNWPFNRLNEIIGDFDWRTEQ